MICRVTGVPLIGFCTIQPVLTNRRERRKKWVLQIGGKIVYGHATIRWCELIGGHAHSSMAVTNSVIFCSTGIFATAIAHLPVEYVNIVRIAQKAASLPEHPFPII